MVKQLQELHGPSTDVPPPYTSAFKDWRVDPYGGGYHSWKAGGRVWEVMPYIRHPHPDKSVHIVGEAYSDEQGWVEGAFLTAEHVMRDKFNLRCPDWLDGDNYLGW